MPSANALAEVARAALHPLNVAVGLRPLTTDEIELLAEAVDAGASVRSDSAFEGFLSGGALPLSWGRHTPVGGKWVDGWAAGAEDRREAFRERMAPGGDLYALCHAIDRHRAALDRAA